MVEILVDETVQQIDKKLWKVTICCVELNDDSIDVAMAELEKQLSEDPIRFPQNGKKLHFSEMNDAQKSAIVEIISKLPITAKVYTYYSIGKNQAEVKVNAMISTVEHLDYLHRNRITNIQIEYANEYTKTSVSKLLVKDYFGFIMPDSILSIYAKHLNELNNAPTSSNTQFYALLKSKIRLQTFRVSEHAEYNQKENRI